MNDLYPAFFQHFIIFLSFLQVRNSFFFSLLSKIPTSRTHAYTNTTAHRHTHKPVAERQVGAIILEEEVFGQDP